MSNDKLVKQVIPTWLFEDRQVAEVMLKPSSLGLQQKKEQMLHNDNRFSLQHNLRELQQSQSSLYNSFGIIHTLIPHCINSYCLVIFHLFLCYIVFSSGYFDDSYLSSQHASPLKRTPTQTHWFLHIPVRLPGKWSRTAHRQWFASILCPRSSAPTAQGPREARYVQGGGRRRAGLYERGPLSPHDRAARGNPARSLPAGGSRKAGGGREQKGKGW